MNRIRHAFRQAGTLLEMIKFEHSVFALPFALTAALLAARYSLGAEWPTGRQFFWIVVAMVGARSAAMTVNRIADIEYDRRNQRTSRRALPAGALSVGFALGFAAIASAVLVVAAWRLNRLALELSPLALAILFFYSYTKRFTMWSHVVLGFCLGISPAAAWIAIAGKLDPHILILCAAVTLWVGGFDVLYACQDIDFDREAGLHSIPRRFGIGPALRISQAMHALTVALLGWLAASFHLPWPAWVGIAVVGALLIYEHSLLHASDLSRLNAAFFNVNGYISLLFLLFWGAAVWVARVPQPGRYP
ncbi:MAG TPA: UbiA-like polyprenyltransferase [Methylomirabilota bacterium]|nr:UbiA-like polyprenyltransferase [Methylomirabilota bacterium]